MTGFTTIQAQLVVHTMLAFLRCEFTILKLVVSSSGYWGTTTLSGSRSWSRNSRSCCSRASNGRDLASTCVLRPRLEELVSLNFRGTELRSEDGLDCGVSYD